MHPDTREIAVHMKEYGLCVFGRAVYDATFSEYTRPYAHALSISQAANAAEILIKARIAQEHPLLIFSKLPTQDTTDDHLTINELFQFGRTYTYEELPKILWATTGIRISPDREYIEFGRLRNSIIHFAVPKLDLAAETLRFTVTFLDPLIETFWGESGLHYSADWDNAIITDGYLEDQITRCGINIDARLRAILGPESENNAKDL